MKILIKNYLKLMAEIFLIEMVMFLAIRYVSFGPEMATRHSREVLKYFKIPFQDTIDEEENRTIKLKIEPDLGEVGDGVANDIEPMGVDDRGVIEQAGVEVGDDGDVIENEENEDIYRELERLLGDVTAAQNAGRGPERDLRRLMGEDSLGGGMTGGNKKHKSHRRKSHNKSKKKKSKKKRSRKKSKKSKGKKR
jgi:hypothetical protein